MHSGSLAFLLVCLGLACAVPTPDHHALRVAEVDRINAIENITWTAGINPRFAGAPLGASKSLCGVKSDSVKLLKDRVKAGSITVLHADPKMAVPESFDSETNWPKCAKVIGDIRDQSDCGCCWAFGAAEAASDRLCIASNGTVVVALSAQETCFCAQQEGCDGGQLQTAWDYINTEGLATGGQNNKTGPFGGVGLCSSFSLPHCHHHGPQGKDPWPAEGTKGCPSVTESPQCPSKCDADSKTPFNDFKNHRYSFGGSVQTYDGTELAIQQGIMQHGPVEAAFTVMGDFENYVSGVYKSTSSKQLGGHAIKIVGWGVDSGVKYWKIANSWNPYWGESGYFRIVRGSDECGIEEQVVASSGEAVWTGPGLAPPPPPGPPTPGVCEDQNTESECESTSSGGKRCDWCVLKGLGIGICQNAGQSCN